MKTFAWKIILAISLLLNAGVIAGAWLNGWRTGGAIEQALFGMGHEQVAERLALDPAQRERWHAAEAGFLRELNDAGARIEAHRQRMVREILGAQPDAAVIERERSAIFALQEAQQRAVIAQLAREREMLRPDQRAALADLLLSR